MDSANAYIYAGGGTPAEQVNLSTGTITYLVSRHPRLGPRHRQHHRRPHRAPPATTPGATPRPPAASPLHPVRVRRRLHRPRPACIYLINRYYDPATGQFLSVDPDVATTDAPYAYADGNPVKNTDENGLAATGWSGYETGAVMATQGLNNNKGCSGFFVASDPDDIFNCLASVTDWFGERRVIRERLLERC